MGLPVRNESNESEKNSIRSAPGRPFQPGQSGNPKGRPPIKAAIRDLARQHTALAIGTLAEIAADRAQPARARVAAAEALLDRGYGRPVSTLDMQAIGAQGGTIAVLFRRPEGPTIDVEPSEDEGQALPPAEGQDQPEGHHRP